MSKGFALIALVLASMIGFAAEPTTSTEADRHEGRAHGAFFADGSPVARVAQVAAPNDTRTPNTVAALAALLALLLGTPSIAAVVSRVAGDGSALRWATTARRGPPAHE